MLYIYMRYIRFQAVKTDKNRGKQKRVIGNSRRQNGNLFIKEVIKNFGKQNLFSVPQTRHQVSSYGLRYSQEAKKPPLRIYIYFSQFVSQCW